MRKAVVFRYTWVKKRNLRPRLYLVRGITHCVLDRYTRSTRNVVIDTEYVLHKATALNARPPKGSKTVIHIFPSTTKRKRHCAEAV